jgi:hypothetical protein
MAALLVTSISRILKESFDCCTYPLSACCELSNRLICSPFTPYLFVSLGFNIPPIVWSYKTIESIIRHGPYCLNGSKTLYILINSIFSLIHIIGSIYIIVRIQQHQRRVVNANEDIENIPHTIKRIYSGGSLSAIMDSKEDKDSYRQLGDNINNNNNNNTTTIPKKNDKSLQMPIRIQSVASTLASLKPQTGNDSQNSNDFKSGDKGQTIIIDDGPPSSFRRLGQVLCYDAGVAGYIVIAFVWMLWQSFGLWVAISSAGTNYYNDDNDDSSEYVDICGNVRTWVIISIVCGFAYMSIVFFSFSCSLLCLR